METWSLAEQPEDGCKAERASQNAPSMMLFFILNAQSVSERTKLGDEEEKEVYVRRSRRKVQDYHCHII